MSNLKILESCSTVCELKPKINNACVPPAGSVLQTQLGSKACMDESFWVIVITHTGLHLFQTFNFVSYVLKHDQREKALLRPERQKLGVLLI